MNILLTGFAEYAATVTDVVGLPLLFAIFVLKGALIGKIFPTSVFLPGYVLLTEATVVEAGVVVVVVTIAHVLGQVLIYLGCRRYGLSFLTALPYVEIDPESDRLQRAESWFERYGGFAIFTSNVIPTTRGLIAIPAAIGSYPLGQHTLHVTTSTLLYHTVYVAIPFAGLAILA